MMFILCQALALICAKCSCHVQLLENVSPRCLCVFTSVIIWLFITIGGWYGLLIFREKRRDSDLAGLKLTNDIFAQLCILTLELLALLCQKPHIRTCPGHSLFRFDWIFMKIGDNLEISGKIRLFTLELISRECQHSHIRLCPEHSLCNFYKIYMKLAGK